MPKHWLNHTTNTCNLVWKNSYCSSLKCYFSLYSSPPTLLLPTSVPNLYHFLHITATSMNDTFYASRPKPVRYISYIEDILNITACYIWWLFVCASIMNPGKPIQKHNKLIIHKSLPKDSWKNHRSRIRQERKHNYWCGLCWHLTLIAV